MSNRRTDYCDESRLGSDLYAPEYSRRVEKSELLKALNSKMPFSEAVRLAPRLIGFGVAKGLLKFNANLGAKSVQKDPCWRDKTRVALDAIMKTGEGATAWILCEVDPPKDLSNFVCAYTRRKGWRSSTRRNDRGGKRGFTVTILKQVENGVEQ